MSKIFSDNEDVGIAAGPTLQIVERTITLDGPSALVIAQPNSEIFVDYMMYNRYDHDLRRYMMGVAASTGFQGKTVAFVQLASPTLLWVCEWTALKVGGQPEIPSPSVDSEWVFLQAFPELPMENVAPVDGKTPVYRISGVYVYGHTNPSVDTFGNVVFPHPPWLKTDGFARTLQPGKLTTGLSTPTSTSNSSTGSKMVPLS